MTKPTTTFVCCLESGALEALTVRLVQSLRRNGGRFAACPILAVTARFGPPLARSTQRVLKNLGVEHLRTPSHPRFAWYHYLNKPIALELAEQVATTPQIAFLDSDVLMLGEPMELLLGDDEDFAACAPDDGIVGTTGPGSRYEDSWRAICRVLGLSLDDLPWVTTCLDAKRIRLYWNSGVFAFRRGLSFGTSYLQACCDVLDAGGGFPNNGEHNLDQVVLGLVMLKLRMRWRALSGSHNYAMASYLPEQYEPSRFADAAILHYHDSMGPHFFEQFLARIAQVHPEQLEWLRGSGPLVNPAPLRWRLTSQALRVARGLPRRAYRNRVRAMDGRSAVNAEQNCELAV